jgi:hypothetical protein
MVDIMTKIAYTVVTQKEKYMPRVTLNQNVFKVQLTEYERGWGQKPWDTVYFDNEAEARKYADDYNKEHNNEPHAPDWYVVAQYEGKVQ